MKLSRLWKKKKKSPYGLFPWHGTWAEAYATTTTYETRDIAKTISDRHRDFLAAFDSQSYFVELPNQHLLHHLLTAFTFIFLRGRPATVKVLDFGGGPGKFYYLVQRALPEIEIDWLVVETKIMAEAHRPFEQAHLHWQTELPSTPEGVNPFDLCIASCCLHYTEKPYDILKKLASLGRYLVVDRLPVGEGAEDRIAIQRVIPQVHDCTLVHWIFSEAKMVEFLSSLGKIRLEWILPQDEKKLEEKPVIFKGYLVENGILSYQCAPSRSW